MTVSQLRLVLETDDLDDLMDCCTILTALGDGVEVRRVVTEQDRAAEVSA